MKGCLLEVADVSAHDREELLKFEQFIKAKASGKTEREAYAEVYGEVVFDATTPAPGPVGRGR